MQQTLFTFAPARPLRRPRNYGRFAAAIGLKPGTNEYKLAWAKANRERRLAHQYRYYETHCEQLREKNQRYRKENPEKRRATCAAWVERNPERHRENRRKSGHRAYHRDPAKFILREHTRRFGEGTVTREQWREIYDSTEGRCVYCCAPATAIDHIVPLTRGGKHEPSNLAPACKPCNSSKHNKLLSEWKGRPCQR